jgi:hypothetical protein
MGAGSDPGIAGREQKAGSGPSARGGVWGGGPAPYVGAGTEGGIAGWGQKAGSDPGAMGGVWEEARPHMWGRGQTLVLRGGVRRRGLILALWVVSEGRPGPICGGGVRGGIAGWGQKAGSDPGARYRGCPTIRRYR